MEEEETTSTPTSSLEMVLQRLLDRMGSRAAPFAIRCCSVARVCAYKGRPTSMDRRNHSTDHRTRMERGLLDDKDSWLLQG
jgi:hypothetical protein